MKDRANLCASRACLSLGNSELVQLPHLNRWAEGGKEHPSWGNGTQPHSQPSHSSLEWWSLFSVACSLKMDGYRKQKRKQNAGGKTEVEVRKCWASEAVILAGVQMGLPGEEVTICYPCPSPTFTDEATQSQRRNWLAQGLRASQQQRQSQPPSLPSKPAVFSLLSYTFS